MLFTFIAWSYKHDLTVSLHLELREIEGCFQSNSISFVMHTILQFPSHRTKIN